MRRKRYAVDRDEWWPVYDLEKYEPQSCYSILLSQDRVAWIRKAMSEFAEVQKFIGANMEPHEG